MPTIFDSSTINIIDMKKLSEMSNRQIRQYYNTKIRSLSWYLKKFEVEKNIKNSLYSFILGKGLFDELVKYNRTHHMTEQEGYERAINNIVMRFPDNMN